MLISICSGFLMPVLGENWTPSPPPDGHPRIYYHDPHGDNRNSGLSPKAAWKDFTNTNRQLFQAGDTIAITGEIADALILNHLAGRRDARITITHYNGMGSIKAPDDKNCITLSDAEFVSIHDITCCANGWTGTGKQAKAVHTGFGIYVTGSRVSGARFRSIWIENCDITRVRRAICFDKYSTPGPGYEDIRIAGCQIHDILRSCIEILGYHTWDKDPSYGQNADIYIGYNTITDSPGDPNESTESCAIMTCCSDNVTIEHNCCLRIAGHGGENAGLQVGGSTAIGSATGRNSIIRFNEIGYTGCCSPADGSAIDIDYGMTGAEVAYNLSYRNVGPAFQTGFSPKRVRYHHNLSIDDALRCNGAIRLYGGVEGGLFFNNTFIASSVGMHGIAPMVEFEQANFAWDQKRPNRDNLFLNNLFKPSSGSPIVAAWGYDLWSNGDSGNRFIANVYDLGGHGGPFAGRLTYPSGWRTDALEPAIADMAAWRRSGQEILDGASYGVCAPAKIPDFVDAILDTSAKSPGSSPMMMASQLRERTDPDSPCRNAGIDPELFSEDLGPIDILGCPSRSGSGIDVGAWSLPHPR